MSGKQQIDSPVDMESLRGLIGEFFPELNGSASDDILWPWFVFAIAGNGQPIKNLQVDELAKFSDQLTKLVAAVHQWGRMQQLAANSQEENRHA
ncbi:hypothetical protein [Mucilaginibacter paludis]|uniref:Uncharacterized protein n=1 Tax=Mucilaginibacter paludis DSM 18603 TaxID=714943 RepID=H1YBL8_9SPHI|nr:hypothetical protein [Mucilaginibacter paludis]EHQ25089.1 hypothetical protein Mucpa_0909 [Mucilaginibacter paludis DSM 18603]